MASTNLARLNDKVRISAPGVLDGVIRMTMYDVLKEFFQRTNAWLFELPVFIVATTNDYQLNTGQNVVVNRLMSLDRPRSPPPPLGPPVPQYLPMCPPQYLMVAANEQPYIEAQNPIFRTQRVGVLLNAGSKCPILRVRDNPTADETWIATLALTPCDPTDADGFVDPPDWVLEKYLNALASGVLCQLMLQPGKPYSSVPGSQYHGRKFNEGVGLARTEVRNMFVFDGQRWAFPGGWNSSIGGWPG